MREGFFFMIQQIVKRDGRMAPFEIDKITNAIFGAAQASGGQDHDMAQELAEQVEKTLEETAGTETPTVEQVQDTVEKVLIESGHARTAKKYILYRNERTRVREMNTRLMKVYEDLTSRHKALPWTSPRNFSFSQFGSPPSASSSTITLPPSAFWPIRTLSAPARGCW